MEIHCALLLLCLVPLTWTHGTFRDDDFSTPFDEQGNNEKDIDQYRHGHIRKNSARKMDGEDDEKKDDVDKQVSSNLWIRQRFRRNSPSRVRRSWIWPKRSSTRDVSGRFWKENLARLGLKGKPWVKPIGYWADLNTRQMIYDEIAAYKQYMRLKYIRQKHAWMAYKNFKGMRVPGYEHMGYRRFDGMGPMSFGEYGDTGPRPYRGMGIGKFTGMRYWGYNGIGPRPFGRMGFRRFQDMGYRAYGGMGYRGFDRRRYTGYRNVVGMGKGAFKGMGYRGYGYMWYPGHRSMIDPWMGMSRQDTGLLGTLKKLKKISQVHDALHKLKDAKMTKGHSHNHDHSRSDKKKKKKKKRSPLSLTAEFLKLCRCPTTNSVLAWFGYNTDSKLYDAALKRIEKMDGMEDVVAGKWIAVAKKIKKMSRKEKRKMFFGVLIKSLCKEAKKFVLNAKKFQEQYKNMYEDVTTAAILKNTTT